MIKQWAPWKQSSGATTPEGRAISKMNACKLGVHDKNMRDIARYIAECGRSLDCT